MPESYLKQSRFSNTGTVRVDNDCTSPAPINLRCEHRAAPLGIDETQPCLSWQLCDTRRGAAQTAYQVIVAASVEALHADTPDLWDSGKIATDQAVEIIYAGMPLESRQCCWWKVRVWDQDGNASSWSDPAFWEMGLLNAGDWQAKWIGSAIDITEQSQPCPHLRCEWRINLPITRARLHVSALGLFALEINERRVGRDELVPGWTDYSKRLMYLTYDVTSHLQSGDNVAGVILGDGWYSGYLLWDGCRNHYGNQAGLLFQLEIELSDGSTQIVCSDETWQTSIGPILSSDLYHGEVYDARLEMPGWSLPGFDATAWRDACILNDTDAVLVSKRNETIQVIEELKPLCITEPADGVYVFDFGQNMVGRARLHMRGEVGTQITLRFAEMLNDDGSIYIENLRTAKATDRYTLRGGDTETWEPRFTFHGFRYVEMTGCPEPPTLDALTGIVMHSATPPTGRFACSNPKINRLQKSILWGQKGNFLDVPTDCPQRDERLGWTGDAQVFVRTAAFNMDVYAFFEKWAFDVADAQSEEGAFSHVAPDLLNDYGSAGWGDAGVLCPWRIYLCYGHKRILEQNFKPMLRWIDYQQRTSHELIRSAKGYGDWLAVDAIAPDRSPTPTDLVGTAYFAYTAMITAQVARIIGKSEEADRLEGLANRVRHAFNQEFVSPGGRVVGHTQTGYLLALAFDLLPEEIRPVAVQHLVDLIEARDWHLSTGFLGTPLLQPVLSRFGRTDVAYRLIFQESYPSWLYPGEQGATTMWERWNSYTKADGFGDAAMNSFNHYAFGAVGEWLYSTVGGIDFDLQNPGYKHAIIRPDPGTAKYGLQWAETDLQTRHGLLSSHWKIESRQMTLRVNIPPNTTATVDVPAKSINDVQESGRLLNDADDISAEYVDFNSRNVVRCDVKAGAYEFVSAGLDWTT